MAAPVNQTEIFCVSLEPLNVFFLFVSTIILFQMYGAIFAVVILNPQGINSWTHSCVQLVQTVLHNISTTI